MRLFSIQKPARLALGLISTMMVSPALAGEITVFAAASLKTALDEVAQSWHASTGNRMRSSYAGSSILARQIIQGADVDVFISANVAWMDVLDKQGLIETESRVNVLGNRLVLIGPTPVQEFDWSDLPVLLGDAPLAMGLVNAVPAGIYGKAALTNLGLWPLIVDRVAQVDNVRAALALVALGEAPFGVVYATDALATSKVSVLKKFSTDSHPPIVYPAAMINNGPMALEFMQFLQGDTAMKVFMRHGFLPSKQTDPNAAEKS